jgi:site-specific DNA-adenine methylase
MADARPFLKWAGGKKQLAPKILELFPKHIHTYYEPFVGGGAVFFALAASQKFSTAVLNDFNAELMNVFKVVRDFPEELLEQIQKLVVTKDVYLQLRAKKPEDFSPVRRAARTMFLNKTCFTPGSQVLLENETWRSIEEVAVGDRLWNGRVVSEVLSRPYYGTVRRIRIQGSPWGMSVTEDHPVLSVKGKGEAKSEKRTLEEISREVNLHEARELEVGDYVFLPTDGTRRGPIDWREFWPNDSLFGPQTYKQRLTRNPQDTDVARLLGYYAAEGHITYQARNKDGSRGRIRSVVWTFHTDERDTYIADLENICWRLFKVRPKVTRGVGNKYNVEVNSVQVATFIRTLVPGQSWAKRAQERKTKRLHTVLMTLAPETQLEILKAWLRGDGGLRHKKYTSELSGTCTVLPMARQMYRLAQRCGLKPSWRISHPKGRTHHVDGSPVDNTTAHVSFSGDDVRALGFEVLPRRACEQRRFVGGYLCVRIKDIYDLPYDGTVHNIEVDGDHLICVDGVISHNCFNGLYRVNKAGVFNVMWGDYKNPTIADPENIRACSTALGHVKLLSEDFEEAVKGATSEDVVYFDPPYVEVSRTANFTSYTSNGFSMDDQRRLAECFGNLAKKGVAVVASNSDTPIVRELYEGWEVHEVQARRAINSKADRRGPVGELIIVGRRAR